MIEVVRSADSFAHCLEIRRLVFTCEQEVSPEEEYDSLDEAESTIHLLAFHDGRPLGTARILPQGNGVCHIGRVAVMKEARGSGIGRELVEEACRIACEHFGRDTDRGREVRIELGAQIQAHEFYEKCGFADCGDEHYIEADIEHCHMERLFRCDTFAL